MQFSDLVLRLPSLLFRYWEKIVKILFVVAFARYNKRRQDTTNSCAYGASKEEIPMT